MLDGAYGKRLVPLAPAARVHTKSDPEEYHVEVPVPFGPTARLGAGC